MGKRYNELRCCDYPAFRPVCSCVLDKVAFLQRAVVTHFRFVQKAICRLCDVSDAEGPQFGNPGYTV